MKGQGFLRRFGYARAGIVTAFRRERSMRTHGAAVIAVGTTSLANSSRRISTFFGIWKYPNQMGAWSTVHLGKWSSWSLLIVMTFTIVANLKHIKKQIHVPA